MRYVLYFNTETQKHQILGRFWTIQQLLVSDNYLIAIKKIQQYNDKIELFIVDDIQQKTYQLGYKEKGERLVINELEIRSKL